MSLGCDDPGQLEKQEKIDKQTNKQKPAAYWCIERHPDV